MRRSHGRIMIGWRAGWQVYPCRPLQQSKSSPHSPAALVVEEEDEVEFLFGFVLHLFSDAEHVHGGHGDGHPVVLAAHARHVGVDDLHAAEGRAEGERGGLRHAGSWMQTWKTYIHPRKQSSRHVCTVYTHTNAFKQASFLVCPFHAKVKLTWLTVKDCHLEANQDILEFKKETAAVNYGLFLRNRRCHDQVPMCPNVKRWQEDDRTQRL